MKKVIVIGCPGSGKSTFARALAEITGLPLFYLDMMYWNADRTQVERSVFRERLSEAMAHDAWIIDGNYGSTMALRLEAADTVFFLDYPTEVCLEGIRARRGKPRPDMPWIEEEEDGEFTAYVTEFRTQSRPQILALLTSCSHKTIHVFQTREQAASHLSSLGRK